MIELRIHIQQGGKAEGAAALPAGISLCVPLTCARGPRGECLRAFRVLYYPWRNF